MRGAGGRFCPAQTNMTPVGLILMSSAPPVLSCQRLADISVERAQGGLPDRSGFAVTFAINEGPRYKPGIYLS